MSLSARLLSACAFFALSAGSLAAEPAPPVTGDAPAQVDIVEEAGAYRLLVNGTPFRVAGAGLGDVGPEGIARQAELARRGGNSFRTWSVGDDPQAMRATLDAAQRNGLMVAVGLDVAKERHGFDYDDPTAVAAQLARLREEVQTYKDHPAVLMWLVGNELNLDARNPAVWDAVGEITRMIHEVDPAHPVMTPLAGLDADVVREIRQRAPELDLLGIQVYGDIDELPQKLRDSGWAGAYIVTEWGPTGHWESPETSWGAPIEDHASRKAELLIERYQRDIDSDRRQGLGSYVFLWGQKQERTPTWYGLFLPDGQTTPRVDAMQYLWTGAWPDNRAPEIGAILVDGREAVDSVTLAPGASASARVEARDPDGDAIAYRWRVREESTATSIGGDPEQVPPEVTVRVTQDAQGRFHFEAPDRAGHYRLFVETLDGHGHAAYANFPFRVAASGETAD